MRISVKLAVVLLIVAVVAVNQIDAQRGGRGRGRGRPWGRGPGQGQGQQGEGQNGDQNGGRGDRGGRPRGGPGGRAGGRPSGRPGGRPGGATGENVGPAGERVSWNQTLTTGQVVKVSAFMPENRTVVIIGNRGDRAAGYVPARTAYGFNADSQYIFMRPRALSPCLFINGTTLTYAGIAATAMSLNGSLVAVTPTPVELDGTGERLTGAVLSDLMADYPALRLLCGRAPIVPAVAPTGAAVDFETRQIKFLTYDQEVTMTLRVPSNPRRGRGRGRG